MAARPENSPPEMVEEVDAAGNVLRLVSRREMRAEGLRHRSVFIAVMSEAGQILVHRRAETKDVWPGWWDLAVGGVCCRRENLLKTVRAARWLKSWDLRRLR